MAGSSTSGSLDGDDWLHSLSENRRFILYVVRLMTPRGSCPSVPRPKRGNKAVHELPAPVVAAIAEA